MHIFNHNHRREKKSIIFYLLKIGGIAQKKFIAELIKGVLWKQSRVPRAPGGGRSLPHQTGLVRRNRFSRPAPYLQSCVKRKRVKVFMFKNSFPFLYSDLLH